MEIRNELIGNQLIGNKPIRNEHFFFVIRRLKQSLLIFLPKISMSKGISKELDSFDQNIIWNSRLHFLRVLLLQECWILLNKRPKRSENWRSLFLQFQSVCRSVIPFGWMIHKQLNSTPVLSNESYQSGFEVKEFFAQKNEIAI